VLVSNWLCGINNVGYLWMSVCGVAEWLSVVVVVAGWIVPYGVDSGCDIHGSSIVGRCGVVDVVKCLLGLAVDDFVGWDKAKGGVH